MTTKYNLDDTVYILHNGKIKECEVQRVRLTAFTDDNGYQKTDECYDVRPDANLYFGHPFIKNLTVREIFPSREALIASL